MSVSIPVVLGTGRDGRQSEKVARYVHEQLAHYDDINTHFVDIRDHLAAPFTIPAWVEDERALKWRKIADDSAGFVFVVPEYNHSFPGEFKLFFDSAFKQYHNKPAVIVGVSKGKYGGVRSIESLLAVMHAAHIEVLGTTVATAQVVNLFDDTGAPSDDNYKEFVTKALEALVTRVAPTR